MQPLLDFWQRFDLHYIIRYPEYQNTIDVSKRKDHMQHTTTDEALNPFPRYHLMREAHPVYYHPQYQFWQVFCYDDVQRVLSDYASFSSAFGGGGKRRI